MAEQSLAAPKVRAAKKSAPEPAPKSGAKHNWVKPFLAALADTSNVAAAARKADIDPSTAYHRRRTNPAFNREWQIALCEGYDNLEMELLHRLRTGELKPAAGGKRAVRSFDNATAFRLLAVHRESAVRERAMRDSVSAADIRESIDRKVEELRLRVLAAKAEREAAENPATAAPDQPHDA
jgi:hypothetical protein